MGVYQIVRHLGVAQRALYRTGSLHISASLQAVGSDSTALLVCHRMPRTQQRSLQQSAVAGSEDMLSEQRIQ